MFIFQVNNSNDPLRNFFRTLDNAFSNRAHGAPPRRVNQVINAPQPAPVVLQEPSQPQLRIRVENNQLVISTPNGYHLERSSLTDWSDISMRRILDPQFDLALRSSNGVLLTVPLPNGQNPFIGEGANNFFRPNILQYRDNAGNTHTFHRRSTFDSFMQNRTPAPLDLLD